MIFDWMLIRQFFCLDYLFSESYYIIRTSFFCIVNFYFQFLFLIIVIFVQWTEKWTLLLKCWFLNDTYECFKCCNIKKKSIHHRWEFLNDTNLAFFQVKTDRCRFENCKNGSNFFLWFLSRVLDRTKFSRLWSWKKYITLIELS